MRKPIVALVGRPNVGKSTLFNRLVQKRIAIVEDTPGVTRDRVDGQVEWLQHEFLLIDTGGLIPESEDIMHQEIFKQAELAMEMADVILFVVDGKHGLLDDDRVVADLLRRTDKPVILVVNKIDHKESHEMNVYEFYELGLGTPMAISAEGGLGTGDLLDEITSHFPEDYLIDVREDEINVAIIGKPNVGKSSIVNKILGEEKMIVTDIPGTTRDAIDSVWEVDGQTYVLIDTAGMRRKSRITEKVERYSVIRTIAAVERADVCVLVISATEGVTEQDAKIAGIAHDRGKPTIIAVNKWDLIEKDDKTMNEYLNNVRMTLSYMPYAKALFISAKTGQRIHKLFNMINEVYENTTRRIATGILNEVLVEAVAKHPPALDKGRHLKIYYMTQVSTQPPTFVLFVNNKDWVHFSYERYLENQIRQNFEFSGTPIRFIFRNR